VFLSDIISNVEIKIDKYFREYQKYLTIIIIIGHFLEFFMNFPFIFFFFIKARRKKCHYYYFLKLSWYVAVFATRWFFSLRKLT